MDFEWDERKNQSNMKKHGVSFDEAKDVFGGCPMVYFDADASVEEDRYVAVGFSRVRLLAVVFTNRDTGVRIISARKASTFEEMRYGRGY